MTEDSHPVPLINQPKADQQIKYNGANPKNFRMRGLKLWSKVKRVSTEACAGTSFLCFF